MGNALSCLLSEPHKISLTHKSSSTAAAAAAAAASFRMTDAKGRKLVGWLVGWLVHRARMQRREKERGRGSQKEDVCFSHRARGEFRPTLSS